ncbi:MAG: FAD-dependent oxidoreductase [Sulfolobales archaeon]|nr:FAD-dependent oxidoreductase [Sulfolobales archaeon]MDW8082921.1 FAD-dependent oxidoreductase [Sulfolobales archaeon]
MKFAFLCQQKPGLSRQKIAVVGAGPAGLTAAGYLVCRGHEVDIYDKLPIPGGMMTFAIPKYRIPLDSIMEGVEELRDRFGVKLNLSTKVTCGERHDEGDELAVNTVDMLKLVENYDATLISTGTWRSRKLGIPGDDAKNVMSALEFLLDIHMEELGLRASHLGSFKKVVVIGGGLSAVDAAEESILKGASEVYLVYRRTIKEAPAGEYEIRRLSRLGVNWIELAAPKSVTIENGVARGVVFQRMKLGEPDESGRPRPIPVPGSEFEVEADIVAAAIGEIPTPPIASECGGIGKHVGKDGKIAVDKSFRIPGTNIFAAGDVVTGPSKIGQAVGQGLRAAKEIDRFLSVKVLVAR